MSRFSSASSLPGFGLSLSFTLFYLFIVVLLPLIAMISFTSSLSLEELRTIIWQPRVLSAFKVTLLAAFFAALFNVFLGLLIAWVLVRYRFFLHRFIDLLVDLPFALPTAVAGIALSALYSSTGLLGSLLKKVGISVAYTPLGIVVALVFVGLPLVVRNVEPILQEFDRELEEASASLGANRLQTFCYVIFPALLPALTTGFTMAFARGLGEYGSVIFIAGNIPMVSEIVPLMIIIELEQYQYREATAIAALMLLLSFTLLFAVNKFQRQVR